MADILTLTLSTLMSEPGLKRSTSPSSSSTLLVGGRGISRSLLLLAAVTAASELRVRVVFFTRTQIQSLPAPLQKRLPNQSPEGLKKITFCYPRTVEELLQQVASLHDSPPPSLIVVDRLEDFLCAPGLHPGERSCAAHLSALLCDTAAFLTQVLEQRPSGSAPCRILASYHSELDPGPAEADDCPTDPVLDVLDRYFQIRCTLDQDRGYGAAAAGLQELWHIYVSGGEATAWEDGPGGAQDWQLLVSPSGSIEFKVVCKHHCRSTHQAHDLSPQ
ncbi:ATPase SWSAP1 [Betta splendens]|uniref:ATPase SWSAP1 n=1 Tax=Betta splendens TaxID=158456 RepID=A0A6P7N579_BETSP|nr:ATPase SWSAP1 [Betta splendens]